MNKAIQYRDDGKFYLFDKPESFAKSNMIRSHSEANKSVERYERELKAFIAAGKEIINPEVLKWANMNSAAFFLRVSNSLKPEDIFHCPENIEFKEEEVDTVEDGGGCYVAGSRIVIRLKLKQVETEKENVLKLLEALQVKEESQDELWNEVAISFMNKYSKPAIEENKSKFTIQRNKNV